MHPRAIAFSSSCSGVVWTTSGDSLGGDSESFFERRLGSERNSPCHTRTPNDLSKSQAERGYEQVRRNSGKHRRKYKRPGERSPSRSCSLVCLSLRGKNT